MGIADVPTYLKEIFLSAKEEVLFVYTADPMDINLPKEVTKEVKISRQNYQKGIVKKLPSSKLGALKEELKNSLEKFQRLI